MFMVDDAAGPAHTERSDILDPTKMSAHCVSWLTNAELQVFFSKETLQFKSLKCVEFCPLNNRLFLSNFLRFWNPYAVCVCVCVGGVWQEVSLSRCGVTTISRPLKMIGIFCKEPYKRDIILQKRHKILWSLPIEATQYQELPKKFPELCHPFLRSVIVQFCRHTPAS